MATVHAARDTVLDRDVAIKILSDHALDDEAAHARFAREARAAARVSDHPNVVTIFDVGEADGQPFIVMEQRTGGTLAQRLRAERGSLPQATALAWLDEAAAALDHAHRHGVVHRDVKPANLLLDDAGRVGVADFGIARMGGDTDVTSTGEVLGTAAYLSPEQALGREATAASDRYALGVLAFELLTGRRPFTAPSAAAQAREHADVAPPAASAIAPGLPVAVDRVLARALAKEPAARWPTAGAMVGALEEALDGSVAEEPTRVLAPVHEAERDRTRATAAIAATPSVTDRHARLLPLAAIALAVLLVGGLAAALLTSGDGSGTSRSGSAASTPRTTATSAAAKTSPAPTTAAAPATTPAAPPTGSDPTALARQGHALLASGDAAGAIAVLQSATKDCPVARTDPCAFALYDLGVALTQAGRRDEAVAVLRERLQNPNQRGAVLAALAAATGTNANAAPGKPGKAPKPGKGHGRDEG